MCFSATASFTTAAILIPAGLYCINAAKTLDKPYWAFAMLPFIFGLQQLLEGGVWLMLTEGNSDKAHSFSLGFILFSHVFWLGWVAYSAYLVESSVQYRKIFKWFTIAGILIGTSMYLPLLFKPEWLTTSIINYSIYYNLIFIFDPYISQKISSIVYSAIILLPLFFSSDRYHNILGLLVFISGLITWQIYHWAFVSVWCYFSAVLSLYIFYVIARSVNIARARVFLK